MGQSAFDWKVPLANGAVPDYQTVDAQITCKVPAIKSSFKIGGANLFNKRKSEAKHLDSIQYAYDG